MRKILLVAVLAAAIGGMWAVSAFACVTSQHTVCAPAADRASEQSSQNNNAPPSQQRATLPDNQGTDRAEEESPAIEPGCDYN